MLNSAAQDSEIKKTEILNQNGFFLLCISQQTLNDHTVSSYAVFGFEKNLRLIEKTSAILPQGKLHLLERKCIVLGK